jgi:hypothetical protein
VATELVAKPNELVTGTTAFTQFGFEFLLTVLMLLIFLPIFSYLLLIVREERQRPRQLHLVALCLAAGMSLLFFLFDAFGSLSHSWSTWGNRLYVGLVVCALALELLDLRRERDVGLRAG